MTCVWFSFFTIGFYQKHMLWWYLSNHPVCWYERHQIPFCLPSHDWSDRHLLHIPKYRHSKMVASSQRSDTSHKSRPNGVFCWTKCWVFEKFFTWRHQNLKCTSCVTDDKTVAPICFLCLLSKRRDIRNCSHFRNMTIEELHVLGKSWKVSKNGDGGVFFDIQVLMLQYACSSLFVLTCCRCWLWWKSPHNVALLSETSIDSRSTSPFPNSFLDMNLDGWWFRNPANLYHGFFNLVFIWEKNYQLPSTG